jgi:hypothetical protein
MRSEDYTAHSQEWLCYRKAQQVKTAAKTAIWRGLKWTGWRRIATSDHA